MSSPLAILIPSLLLYPLSLTDQREESLTGGENGITSALDLYLSIIQLRFASIILYLALSKPILIPEWG